MYFPGAEDTALGVLSSFQWSTRLLKVKHGDTIVNGNLQSCAGLDSPKAGCSIIIIIFILR